MQNCGKHLHKTLNFALYTGNTGLKLVEMVKRYCVSVHADPYNWQ